MAIRRLWAGWRVSFNAVGDEANGNRIMYCPSAVSSHEDVLAELVVWFECSRSGYFLLLLPEANQLNVGRFVGVVLKINLYNGCV